MSKRIHRQLGRIGTRSADESNVAMIIKEVEDTDIMLGKLHEHTKRWRDSWDSMLAIEINFADSFRGVYKNIPRMAGTQLPPPETDEQVLERADALHKTYEELKQDMTDEVGKAEFLLIHPIGVCREALKPVKKAIERRENKKLDFERFNKQVENGRNKKNKSEREYNNLHKAEQELEKATAAYEFADEHLKGYVPPLITRILEFLPLIIEISAEIQFTLLQHSYSAFYHYTNEYGFVDTDADQIVAEWEEVFLPLQKQIETEMRMIASGKAIMVPMSSLSEEKTLVSRLNPMNSFGRGKKMPPPPPPPPGPAASGSSAPSRIGRQRSSTSLGSKHSSRKDPSPPPTRTNGRPSISSARSKTEPPSYKREESPPPPPLPSERPSIGNMQDEYKPHTFRSGSYGGVGGGAVAATPLAGLKPSQLRGGTSPSRSPVATSPAPSLSTIAAAKKKPPPPPPKKKGLGETWVKALYTFQGQDAGDLSFREGDKIKVTKKTGDTNDWWDGECNGKKGAFPANYCEPL